MSSLSNSSGNNSELYNVVKLRKEGLVLFSTYYKFNYEAERYLGLTNSLTLRGRLTWGYGGGYGDNKQLPGAKITMTISTVTLNK